MTSLPIDQILCGDNVEILKAFPKDCIDLTVTSPPYDLVDYDDNGRLVTYPNKGLRDYNGYSWDFATLANELWRVTKPGGVVVWVVNDATVDGSETGSSFRQALCFMGLGFCMETMIYQTDKPPMNDNRYQACFEYMFVFSKGSVKTWNPIMVPSKQAGKKRTAITYRQDNGKLKEQWRGGVYNATKVKESIWYFPAGASKGTQDDYAFNHPGTFPESLAHDHIISWSNPGDLVLDPFIGSGTTAKMAVKTDRHYIGIDVSEEYCQLARRRIAAVKAQPRLFSWDLQPAVGISEEALIET